MKSFFENSKQAILITLVMFFVCGLVYPAAVTVAAQVVFKHEANGSMIKVDGKTVGSEKIGQAFTSPEYFWGRVSSINYNVYSKEDTIPDEQGERNYNGVSSGTFNYAPSNPELEKRIESDIAAFLQANPTVDREEIPADLVTASGSGQDPHISTQAALIQIDRVAANSGISIEELKQMVVAHTQRQLGGLFGEDTVNVLALNLEIFEKLND